MNQFESYINFVLSRTYITGYKSFIFSTRQILTKVTGLFLLLFAFLVLCQLKVYAFQSSSYEVLDFERSKSQTDVKLSSIVDDFELIPLSTSQDALIGKIDKLLITSDFIFVLDRFKAKCVFQFDTKGNFIRKVGQVGPGPEEYQMPLDFILNDDNILIMDSGIRVVTYNFEGNFINNAKLRDVSGFYFEKLDSGWVFVGGGGKSNLIITDQNFRITHEFFPYVSRSVDRIIINPLHRTQNGTIVYRRNLRDTIYQVTEKGINPFRVLNYKPNQFDLNRLEQKTADRFLEKGIQKYYITKQLWEASNTTFTVMEYKSENWFYIHKHDSKKSMFFKRREFFNDITFNQSSVYPKGIYQDKIIYAIESSDFMEGVLDAKQKGIEVSDEVVKVQDTISEDDNPILFLVKFKSDL